MVPWEQLGAARAPEGGALKLMRRGAEFSIRLDGAELMNSRLSGSEEALATLALDRLKTRAPRVLIGGLGMGFTLRAALARMGPDGRAAVAELAPAVAEWARGPMAGLFDGCLDDPRTELRLIDVGEAIREAPRAWDAILLDVDNGPEGLTRPGNDRLYDEAGLASAAGALRPGGVLAVWSAVPDAGFAKRLKRGGWTVEEVRVRAHRGRSGARHVIWLGTRPDGR